MIYKHTLLAIAALALIIVAGCENTSAPASEPEASAESAATAETSQEELLALGEKLVWQMDCNVCHSPKIFTPQGPIFDTTRLLSGHPADLALDEYDPAMVAPGKWTLTNAHFTAWVGAWGTSFAANLTPDASGLGAWTFDNFKTAIRHGKLKGLENGRPLLPPMPWEAYSISTDEELLAIFTYLKSIPPVSNVVPQPIPPAPM